VVDDALQNPEANDEVIGGAVPKGPAKRVAKVVNLMISIGDDDRDRTVEEFIDFIKKSVGAIEAPFVVKGKPKPGVKVSLAGGHYILDGKVCLPEDYDPKKHQFKKGATPPVWAGGPKQGNRSISAQQRQMDYDLKNLTPDEYDKKYHIGKYAPKPDMSKIITPEMQAKRLSELKAEKLRKEEEELEEFEWDEDDISDDKKLGKVADKSASDAVARMKKSSKKVVRRTKK
jgi:hypothetical protein